MAKSKIWHVTSRNADNDTTEIWTADESKAREAFASCLDDRAMNLVEDGIASSFFCYVGDCEVYETKNGLAEFNEKHGTSCKDWKEAAIVAGGFSGECGCASSEAYIEAVDGEVLSDGKAVVYQVVELTK